MNFYDLVYNISFLESKIGHKIKFENFNPNALNSCFNSIGYLTIDTNKLNEIGKIIAEFIGLKNIVCNITLGNMNERTGVNISIDNSNFVFVEISRNLTNNFEATIAVICHEITHKYLFLNNIVLKDELENEILTDICTVYLGLGKLMINGSFSRKETSFINEKSERFKNTLTQATGYLEQYDFIVAYLIISHLRKISFEDVVRGIDDQPLKLLKSCEKQNSLLFKSMVFDFEKFEEINGKSMLSLELSKNNYQTLFKTFNELKENMSKIEKCLSRLEAIKMAQEKNFIDKYDLSHDYNNCSKTLKSLLMEKEFEEIFSSQKINEKKINKVLKRLKDVQNELNAIYEAIGEI